MPAGAALGAAAIAGNDGFATGADAGAAGAAPARGAGAPAVRSLPHVRQNCICLGLSVPQRVQREAIGLAAGAATALCADDDAPPPSGVPHAWQNALCGGFSRWQ